MAYDGQLKTNLVFASLFNMIIFARFDRDH